MRSEADALGGSFKVAELLGVDIRIHVLFVVWVVMNLVGSPNPAAELTFLLVLFLSVLLHELGHCAGARAVGGEAKEIILWPLGGLAMARHPDTWRAELVTIVAGPAVNLVLAALAVALLALDGHLARVSGVGDLQSHAATTALGLTAIHLLWCNVLLFLFNVLPAYPMDGGKILRALLWPLVGWRRATLAATAVAIVFGALFVALGLWLLSQGSGSMLALIGVLNIMASLQERQRATLAGGWRR